MSAPFHLRLFIVTIILTFLTGWSGSAAARDDRASSPPSDGKAQIVGGTLLISIGPSVGGTLMLAGLLGACPRGECRDRNSELLAGTVLTMASVISGLFLISEGRAMRSDWEDWQDEHDAAIRKVHAETASFLAIDFAIFGRSPAISLTATL